MNREELVQDFLEYLDVAIDTYCEEMQLDEETSGFILELSKRTLANYKKVADKGGEADGENIRKAFRKKDCKEETTEEATTEEVTEEQIGEAFKTFLQGQQYPTLEAAFQAFVLQHKLDETARDMLVHFIQEAHKGKKKNDHDDDDRPIDTKKSGVKKNIERSFAESTTTKQLSEEKTSPKMQRYLRALGC